jgi:predicted nucleotidyltransferase
MPGKSSDSVKVFFADKNEVFSQLKGYVSRLRSQRDDVEQIGLFGSYATDTYGPASDVDLLIVLHQSNKRFLDRMPEFIPNDLSAGCDVFVYTRDEIEQMKQQNNPWIMHVLSEVIWL